MQRTSPGSLRSYEQGTLSRELQRTGGNKPVSDRHTTHNCFSVAPATQIAAHVFFRALIRKPIAMHSNPPTADRPAKHPQSGTRTFFSRKFYHRIVIGSALLLAFAIVPTPAHGQSGNTKTGDEALSHNTTGDNNTADGYAALYFNTTGSFNTADGALALRSNTTGGNNTANGMYTLYSNTSGERNTANGSAALYYNTTGSYNTASGSRALYSNTEGINNTADGYRALYWNTTGRNNTAIGYYALDDNTTGSANTATGTDALSHNTSGRFNTADGYRSLFANTEGINNTAHGVFALYYNTTGSSNIAVGYGAGVNLTTGDNNIAIGAAGEAADTGTIRIGEPEDQNRTFVAGIFGATVPNGVRVVVNPNGRLGTVVSSGRFKEAVKPMNDASEALFALQPVTFRYKHELDPDGIPQFGLIAEEVEKVNPELVARDTDGTVNTVRYDAINAMLLNEFLKEHRKVQKLEAAVAQQQTQIEQLTAGLQKVSNQLELKTAKPKVAGRKNR